MANHSFGKFGITTGGDYDSTKQYDRLTQVRHNGSSWISLQATQGNEPLDTSEYWMKIVSDKEVGDAYIRNNIGYVLDHELWRETSTDSSIFRYDLKTYLEHIINYTDNMKIDIYLDEDATEEEEHEVLYANIKGFDNQYLYAYCPIAPAVDIPIIITY